MFPFLVLTALWLLVTGQDLDTCKQLNAIKGCHCSSGFMDIDATISCVGVKSLDEMRKIFDITKGKKIYLELVDLTVGDFPSDLFHGQFISNLDIENGDISSFGEKPFSGLEDSLDTLRLVKSTSNKQDLFTNFALGHLNKLQNLIMDDEAGLQEIPDSWFQGGLTTAKRISFEKNKIATIGDNVFASMVNLESIWLADNILVDVKRSMFSKPANQLTWIDLAYNRIKELPSDIFSDMPRLNFIELSGNLLYTVDQATWGQPINNLAEIFLSGNPLHCDQKMRWIYETNVPKRLRGSCSSPDEMKGKKLEDLISDDFE